MREDVMSPKRSLSGEPLPGTPGSELVRSYVWEWPVRITHWVVVLCILVLSVTGYYIHNPFFSTRSEGAFLMGMARFVHVVTGFVLTSAFLVRFYWFFAGNRCSSWRGFLPFRKRQWRDMGQMIKYYTFLRWNPVHRVGHNPLAALAYMAILTFLLISIVTGFTLFSATNESPFLVTVFGWIGTWIGIQYVRSIHYFLMFIFLAFVIHHVYSAILVSIEERNGLFESIITGYKHIPKWELAEDECAAPPQPEE
jgi:Ni/Fe-hydrogenase 1 B-type cytochrome subunit